MNNTTNDDDLNDEEFMKKHAKIFFKTNNSQTGSRNQYVPVPTDNNHSGKFTDHLLMATMYRNHSLNTTCDKEKYIEGSKDWMEHLQ